MAVFGSLLHENKVQVGDKLRFDCVKSFVPTGSTAISTMTLSPGVGISAVNIYSATVASRYLDWAYSSWTMDIDSTNNALTFNEGGATLTATLTSGNYTLATLLTEIKTQLDAAGALTYTVTSSSDKITVASTGTFQIVENDLWNQLGFKVSTSSSLSGAATYTGKRVRYFTKKVVLTVGNGTDTDIVTQYLKLYSVDGDALFSSDGDLINHEPDILKYVPDGKNSFKNMHRRAQELIISWLDEKGYVDIYDDKFTLDSFVNNEEVKEWSTFLTLKLIFQGLKNAVDDVFSQKAQSYEAMEKDHRNRAYLRLDLDGDGTVENQPDESVFVSSISAARR